MLSELTDPDFSITNLCQIDKVFRLKHRIKSRIDNLTVQSKLSDTYNGFLYNLEYKHLFNKDIQELYNIYNRLDNNNVICNKTYEECYSLYVRYPKTLKEHAQLLFGGHYYKAKNVKEPCPELKQFLINLKNNTLKSRKFESLALLRVECQYRYKQGWYFVFNTLTVDNNYLSDVFSNGSAVWTNYIRSIDRMFGIKSFGDWRTALRQRKLGNEFHQYFAVVERGGETGRLHIHVLHMFKDLPDQFVDPNYGARIPVSREIDYMKSFWKYGYSSPIAVRFNSSDAYAKKFWRWPVEKMPKVGYVSLETSDIERMINYVGKYISKTLDQPINSKEVIRWRIRKSRTMSKQVLQVLVDKLKVKELALVMVVNPIVLKMRGKILPIRMLRLMVLRKLMIYWTITNCQKLSQFQANLMPRENIVKQFVNMISLNMDSKMLSIGDLKVRILTNLAGSSLLLTIKEVSDMMLGELKNNYVVKPYSGAII